MEKQKPEITTVNKYVSKIIKQFEFSGFKYVAIIVYLYFRIFDRHTNACSKCNVNQSNRTDCHREEINILKQIDIRLYLYRFTF